MFEKLKFLGFEEVCLRYHHIKIKRESWPLNNLVQAENNDFFKIFTYFIFGCVGSLWPCAGFSLRWLLLLWSTGSRLMGFSSCGSRALERRLSSCGSRALERRLSSCGARA